MSRRLEQSFILVADADDHLRESASSISPSDPEVLKHSAYLA